ncbi:MAG: HIT family protein [Myxococcales bacterium]|nr:HIT family protein [Myxococcales bacterium]
MAESCIFCLIAAGRAEAVTVFADPAVLAFMDTRPIRPGHVLIIPRAHHSDLLDLEPSAHASVFGAARVVGQAVRAAFRPKRLGMVVAGFDVPHAHVHLIPMAEYHDITSRPVLEGTVQAASISDLRLAAARIKLEMGGA